MADIRDQPKSPTFDELFTDKFKTKFRSVIKSSTKGGLSTDKGFFGHMDPSKIKKTPKIRGGQNS